MRFSFEIYCRWMLLTARAHISLRARYRQCSPTGRKSGKSECTCKYLGETLSHNGENGCGDDASKSYNQDGKTGRVYRGFCVTEELELRLVWPIRLFAKGPIYYL